MPSPDFDFTPPTWFKPDGTAMVWDSQSKTYTERGGKNPMGTPGKDNSVPDTERATGGDNNLFDPTEPMDQVGNPMFEGVYAAADPPPGMHDIANYIPQLLEETQGNATAARQLLTLDLMKHMGLEDDAYGKNKLRAWGIAGNLIEQHQNGGVPGLTVNPPTELDETAVMPDTVPLAWQGQGQGDSPEQVEHLVRHATQILCPQCQQPQQMAGGKCHNCGHVFSETDGAERNLNTDFGPFNDVQPKEDFAHMPGVGIPTALGHKMAEAQPMGLGIPTAKTASVDDLRAIRHLITQAPDQAIAAIQAIQPEFKSQGEAGNLKALDMANALYGVYQALMNGQVEQAAQELDANLRNFDPTYLNYQPERQTGPTVGDSNIDQILWSAYTFAQDGDFKSAYNALSHAWGKAEESGDPRLDQIASLSKGWQQQVLEQNPDAIRSLLGGTTAKTAEAQPMGLGDNAGGMELNFDDMFQPGIVGGKQETHRFVLDPAHNMYIAPATMDHGQIVKQNGIQEFARGSVYGDGTAEINLQRMPGQIDRGSVEQQLQTHIGGPVSLTYMPQEQAGTQETGGTFVAHGTAATEVPGTGFAWRKESGVPGDDLVASVSLVFVAEHAETTDYPIYIKCRGGFVTATGGSTSHAAVVARQSGLPCLVGIGADYNKIGQGASVSIDGKGAAQVGAPNPKVQEYMQRGEGEWANAMDRRQDMEHEFRQRTPEWLRPNVGGSVDRPEEQAYEVVNGVIAPVVSATLDECPECTSPMVDRQGQKLCHSCGHRQQIMYAATKESIDLNPIDFAKENPWEAAAIGGVGLGLAAPFVLPAAGAALGLGAGAEAAGIGGEVGADVAAEQAGLTGVRGALKGVLNRGQQVGMAGMGLQGVQQGAGMLEGAAGMNTPPGPDMSNEQAQLASVRRAATFEGMWDFDFDPRYADADTDATGGSDEPIEVADDDEEEHEPQECPRCGGHGELLGNLGKRKHYRCRDCGTDFSHQHRESNKTGDELEVGGQRDDGDDITDEQTQGARLDHGDETGGESLRDTGDTGSANSYDPAQSAALEAFQNEPNIKVFMESPESGRGHEGIERIIDMLAKAFPGAFDDLLPDAQEPEHTDSIEDTNQGQHPQDHGSDMPDSKLGGTMDMTEQMADFLRKQGYSVEKRSVPHRAPNEQAKQHVPEDAPWVTKDGTKIEPGKRYMMTANGYSIPDDVTIDQVTHNEIRYTIHGKGMDFPDTLDRKEFEHQGGFDFELKSDAPENIVHEVDQLEQMPAQNAGQDAGTADPGQTDDLSDLPTPVSHEQVGESVFENIPEEHISPDSEGELVYRDPTTGEEMNYQQYAAHLAAGAPEGMKWLWEDKSPTQDTEISDRMKGMMMATAGRNFTPAQQKEFIQEQGEARNLSKLDLKDTHYTEHDGSNVADEECWF